MSKNIGSEYIKDEYLCLHETVQNYDSKLITIKAWSVTLGMAGIVTGFLQENPTIFLLAAISSVLFWSMDAMWRKYQILFNNRILELEDFLRKDGTGIEPFQISSSFSHYLKLRRGLSLRLAFSLHVMLPHIAVVLGGAVLWFLSNTYILVSYGDSDSLYYFHLAPLDWANSRSP